MKLSDEAEQVSLPEAVREARRRFPRRGKPDVSLVISHAKRLQINDREKRRLRPHWPQLPVKRDGNAVFLAVV